MADAPVLAPEVAQIFSALALTGRTQRELADVLGIAQNKVSKARTGERRFTAAEVLKARDWLSGLLDGAPESESAPVRPAEDDTVEINMLDLSFSMGNGTTIDDYIEETPIKFDLSYVRSFTRAQADALRIARGVGESMYPTLISSDLVWIDTTQTQLTQQDRVWAISLYGAAAIKRLRRISQDRVLVLSDNPAVPDQEVNADDLLIGGRVIRFARDL